ncbi:EipB family protein [Jiella sonneratiae]|uniref:DUF1849 family protein n=1 Tax=Jiella sonneratiae TaxID=2816856 RepID=A0ABS3J603_9HYPH|nr:DUF1849 family protein [Jiella sonneratiae]MBO0905103.1 DUF1849 family protein [Jiella sonneratiae]
MTQRASAAQWSRVLLAFCVAPLLAAGGAAAAEAAALTPHRAAYEVGLDAASDEILGVDGRIAVALSEKGDCSGYGIDYRFVARFLRDQEIVVTDQQIRLGESRDGKRFTFDAESFVDSVADSTTKGEAKTADGKTVVAYSEPSPQEVTLEAALFPIHHTQKVIEAAKAGVPIFESRVFQGDSDAEKDTTSTVVITPLAAAELSEEIAGYGARPGAPAGKPLGGEGQATAWGDATAGADAGSPTKDPGSAAPQAADPADPGEADPTAPDRENAAGEAGPDAVLPGEAGATAQSDAADDDADPAATDPAAIAERLEGLKAWKVTESFYNSDSDEDGLPVFETVYTLFENGVTGNQLLKFDGYSLKARLASLQLDDAPTCPVGD